MDIVQTFYDGMAADYSKLFSDWEATTREQGAFLDGLFAAHGFDRSARVLDCACGIGTQTLELARLGYPVTASDISEGELAQARRRATAAGLCPTFARGDFRRLEDSFDGLFDIVICMDNALPHMLTAEDLAAAVNSMAGRLRKGGLLVASLRDYDALLAEKPPYSPPYIHRTPAGQRVCFQTWDWQGNTYDLTQYIIEDGETLSVSKYPCRYRAFPRQELTQLLEQAGCRVQWLMPDTSGFYQPVAVAEKL